MGDIKKATEIIGAPVIIPEEGPVISRDELVTTTTSSMTVTTVTKTRAEINDETTGKQVTRDTTTTVEKVERNTPDGVILMETKTSESWVNGDTGTLHFIESESTTTRSRPGSRPGSAGASMAPQNTKQEDDLPRDSPGRQPVVGSANDDPTDRDQKRTATADDVTVTVPETETDLNQDHDHLQPPPHCQLQRNSTVSHPQEPPM